MAWGSQQTASGTWKAQEATDDSYKSMQSASDTWKGQNNIGLPAFVQVNFVQANFVQGGEGIAFESQSAASGTFVSQGGAS